LRFFEQPYSIDGLYLTATASWIRGDLKVPVQGKIGTSQKDRQ